MGLDHVVEMQRNELLKDDFRVMLQVFDTSNKNKGHMTLSKLFKIFDGRIDREVVSQSIDRLFDEGILSAKYEKMNNKWVRIYFIAGEAEGFVESVYQKVARV